MASKEQIKKVILAVAGDPESGPIFDFAERWADAIVSLDTNTPFDTDAKDGDRDGKVQDGTPHERPAKETRVTKPAELR
jgi:hypothetical protein